MVKRVFFSREINDDHPAVQSLTDAGVVVLGQSLVQFSPVDFDEIPRCDWIFFYSKQGIRHFFNRLDRLIQEGVVGPDHPLRTTPPRYATFGPASGRFLTSFRQLTAGFTGTGKADTTTAAFLPLATNRTVLFVRGQRSRQSVQQILDTEQVTAHDLIVYHNEPVETFSIPLCRYLAFTSPLNAQAYFSRYTLKPWQKVFAIGDTTEEALLSLGVKKVMAPATPTMECLATLILESIR